MINKRFVKGLFKDTTCLDQPEGTWRYALNAIVQDKDGTVSNETGNTPDGRLAPAGIGENFLCIGHIEVANDKVVLFLRDRRADTSSTLYESSIGIWEAGTFTTLYKPVPSRHNLNFNIDYPIEGTFKIDSEGDLVVYFTDDLNPPRAFNVTRQQGTGLIITTSLYGLPISIGDFGAGVTTDNNRTHVNHINLLNLFPSSGPVPHIELDEVSEIQSSVVTGGGLRTGVYYLALAYVDTDNVATNYVTASNPVSIVDEYDFTRPTFRKDGAKEGSQTSKSIKWLVSNVNHDYELIRPTIIRKMGGVSQAFRLPDLDCLSASATGIVFSGLEGMESSAVADVLIDTIAYDTAKTINQLDGVLYLGNTTRTLDLGYQAYANNIKLNSVVKTISNFDEFYATVDNLETGFGTTPIDNGNTVNDARSYRYAPNIFKYKGYQRDEVYAFYIAFILNDGSMSYAYHIPGRESIGNELDSPSGSGVRSDLASMSSYAANFHFFDNSIETITTTQMNYWQNATEFYPNTNDFDIKDETGLLGSLQGLNVRHHHFPSNENSQRKTIAANLFRIEESVGTFGANKLWNGRLLVWQKGTHYTNMNDDFTTGYAFDELWEEQSEVLDSNGLNVTDEAAEVLLGHSGSGGVYGIGNTLYADQPMQVVTRYLWGAKKVDNGPTTGFARIVINDGNGLTSNACQDTGGTTNNNSGWSGCPDNFLSNDGNDVESFSSARTDCGNAGSGFRNLYPGGSITVRGKAHKDKNDEGKWRQAKYGEFRGCPGASGEGDDAALGRITPSGEGGTNSFDGYETHSWQQWNIVSGIILAYTLTDAILSHDVNILGFELEDIKIPEEIANKVQGFRIYHARRKHADKRILGQDYIKPMSRKKEIIGLCSEASIVNAERAGYILRSLQDEKEIFYSKAPWPDKFSDIKEYKTENLGLNAWNTDLEIKPAYNLFSTHDFNLLRTKNSIAGFTHIKPEYVVENFAFNGPTTNQDKKMVTKLINYNSPTEPVEVQETWGYDPNFNCYPKGVKTGIFLGARYDNMSFLSGQSPVGGINPRMVGQKSKSYLHGDSIFDGTALGFGGKIFNEFGETAMIFGLMEGHYLPALPSNRVYIPGDSQLPNTGNQINWGEMHLSAPSILLFPFPTNTTTDPFEERKRSVTYLVNLHAFRTDMYKSIDSQELIWTGFEVLGDDLKNFTFNDKGMSGTGNTIDIQREGIFGGDTFISRYGLAMGVKPSNPSESSHPTRAIYSNIVESVDNINFRHSESSLSNYFPATSAKELLKYVGTSSGTETTDPTAQNSGDYTAQDNIKYNEDYSSLNDIRPAIPLPLNNNALSDFPTRTHRSAKADTSSVIDNYRIFLANQFKDLPKNRGELWKLSAFNNLLYFHMEESLFATKGKQSMQMKDGSEAFVGSGDIFAQDPDELVQTQDGYAGTQSQWAALTTRAGYFFVDRVRGKVFLMQDKLAEISNVGMESWFRENLVAALSEYGSPGSGPCNSLDNPVIGIGLTSVWDPKYKRIILTKRDLEPTAAFLKGWNQPNTFPIAEGSISWDKTLCNYVVYSPCPAPSLAGEPATCEEYTVLDWGDTKYFTRAGWTISYFPELAVWTSFHDYIPYRYFNTSETFYSLTDRYTSYLDGTISTLGVNAGTGSNDPFTAFGNAGIWKHNEGRRGVLYQEEFEEERFGNFYNFEFEFIHNENKQEDAIYHNISYTADVYDEGVLVLNQGFTSFYAFNTFQISGNKTSSALEYLINIRRIGNKWNVNKFRDLATLAVAVAPYYTPEGVNVVGGANNGTLTSSNTIPMFTVLGMVEAPTDAYITLPPAVKPYFQQKKFMDKWFGVRLIYDNISNNLINLHSTTVGAKKLYR
tara:strand:+ start:753 stop:6320 length:5568 start_codon:yes stop_codon:yes gene_type:complete